MTNTTSDTKPRPRWGRRIGYALLGLILIVVVGHQIWWSIERHRMQSRISALQTAGEPILPTDFAPPTVAAALNAAPQFHEAGRSVESDVANWPEDLSRHIELPLTAAEREVIEGIVERNGSAYAMFDRARTLPHAEWSLNLTSPVLLSMFPDVKGVRRLADALNYDALLAYETGDQDRALQRLESMFALRAYAGRHPTYIGHLISLGVSSLATRSAIEMTPELKIGTAPGDATPEHVRAFIDLLLDDAASQESFLLAIRGERMLQVDVVQCMDRGMMSLKMDGDPPTRTDLVLNAILRPVIFHGGAFLIDYMNASVVLSQSENLPELLERVPAEPVRRKVRVTLIADMLLPSFAPFATAHFSDVAQRRLAATALAIRWHAVEHEGALPERLEDLVPRYLPAVPEDPMTVGQPLMYRREGDAPAVYSLGRDGVDDGGVEDMTRRRDWGHPDRVVHLARRPRPQLERFYEGALKRAIERQSSSQTDLDRAAPTTVPAPVTP